MIRSKANTNFKENIERKKDRYENLAIKNNKIADEFSICNVSGEKNTGIPFGQPILVGHHSEKRHRAHLKRIDAKIEKGFKAMDKADYYENKAKTVGRGGIMSDDPEAIIKIKAKISRLEEKLKYTKEVNKILRKKKFKGYYDCSLDKDTLAEFKVELLKVVSEKFANSILEIASYGRRCSLNTTYLATPLREAKKRLEYMIKEEEREVISWEFENGIEVKEEDGRINIYFGYKPEKEIRDIVKRYPYSFKYSPTREAWTRKKTSSMGSYFFEKLKAYLTNLS